MVNDHRGHPWVRRIARAGMVPIVDGVYLLRPQLRGLWDFRIFVEIDFDLVLARGTARDSAWMAPRRR